MAGEDYVIVGFLSLCFGRYYHHCSYYFSFNADLLICPSTKLQCSLISQIVFHSGRDKLALVLFPAFLFYMHKYNFSAAVPTHQVLMMVIVVVLMTVLGVCRLSCARTQ